MHTCPVYELFYQIKNILLASNLCKKVLPLCYISKLSEGNPFHNGNEVERTRRNAGISLYRNERVGVYTNI